MKLIMNSYDNVCCSCYRFWATSSSEVSTVMTL